MSQQSRDNVLDWVSPESDPWKVSEHKEVWEMIPKSLGGELEKGSREGNDATIRWGNEPAVTWGNCDSFQLTSYGRWSTTFLRDVPLESQGRRGTYPPIPKSHWVRTTPGALWLPHMQDRQAQAQRCGSCCGRNQGHSHPWWTPTGKKGMLEVFAAGSFIY